MKFALIAAAATGIAVNAAVATTGSDPHCVCCAALTKDLGDKVYYPRTEDYKDTLAEYYSANAAQRAWCMVLPESTEDVVKVVKVLNQKKCPFGMRSGGHSAWKGSNGIKDGVTVDFSYMNATTYDSDTGLASIQPGARWDAVYNALDPYNLTATGGRADVVGVGGFSTGAGYSFFSNRYGFACDTMRNFEIVLYNGTVVNANAHENADLWLAQKGGSGNLGFVTRFDQATIKGNKLWGGFTSYKLSHRSKVFNAYVNFNDNMQKDPASQNIVALYYDATGYSVRAILTNSKAITNAPAFDEYFAIANTSSTASVGTVAEQVPQFTGPTPLGQYANWFVGMSTNNAQTMELIYAKLRFYTKKMKAAAPDSTFSVLIEFQPVTKSMVKHSAAQGGNVLGLERHVKNGPINMWLIALTVDTKENQAKILPYAIQYRDEIIKSTTAKGTNVDWVYLNYAWKDQDPIATYGKKNIRHLQAASAKYDPEGVFQNLRQTGFKIPAGY